ncbi:hypothetical protein LVJ94_08200 [Pendulispora rubella]|uniref:Cytochrome c-552/4 domain-containing protein n=1 Tax=Pendulispora rubella TaxID=2741070 RepID=A0ABZ2LDG9_9BACT
MSATHYATKYIAFLGILAGAVVLGSCTDPVIDDAIERLGDEPGSPGEGPEHRPGQPCVLCHRDGGPASSHFAVAGTIYDGPDSTSKPVTGAEVIFVDAVNNYPRQGGQKKPIFTNKAGNFYVLAEDWPDLQFPFHVKVVKGASTRVMVSHVGREPSCAGCHRDPDKNVSNDKYGAVPRVNIR